MKTFLIFYLIFIWCPKGWAQNDLGLKAIEILASSELSIKGDTNISEFGCVFNTIYLEECREVIYKKNGNDINFSNAVLSLKNKGFDCGNKAINKDFHSLLKTKTYPIITLELTKITLTGQKIGEARVKIMIAGAKREYMVPVSILSEPTNRFVGKLKLDIKDFNLEPPKKMFGLIVIKEKIEIDFKLVAK